MHLLILASENGGPRGRCNLEVHKQAQQLRIIRIFRYELNLIISLRTSTGGEQDVITHVPTRDTRRHTMCKCRMQQKASTARPNLSPADTQRLDLKI